jgi:hypothetical protein
MIIGSLRRKIGKTVLFAVITLLFSVALYTFITVYFSIQTIEIVGKGIQIIVDEKKISKTLLFFPSDRFKAEILRDNPLLSDVVFSKKYPHTLVITPVIRPAFVKLRTQDRTVLIDREGYVLIDGDQGINLPVFRFAASALRVGEKITDKRILQSLSIFDSLRTFLVIHEILEQNGPYVLVKTDKSDIFIPHDKETQVILATLQTLMAGFRIKGTLPAVVDLRFDKPVIKL